MQIEEKQYDVGVIVGRFQVPVLHAGHLGLVSSVRKRHGKVVVFLGVSPLWATASNPLDFEARKQLLLDAWPDLNVLYIKDNRSDEFWSGNLDSMIRDVVTPSQSVVLYGSRDSFIPHYSGRYPTAILEPSSVLSGTAERSLVAASSTRSSVDFRAGAVWAASARFPTAYTTVDVAIHDQGKRWLMGRKHGETLFRFIGGFSDPNSDSFEADAKREVNEETGVEVADLRYIGSRRQDDWRYRSEKDCIKTMFFIGQYAFGRPTPGDDIEEVRWFDTLDMKASVIVPEHRPLLEMLDAHISTLKEV